MSEVVVISPDELTRIVADSVRSEMGAVLREFAKEKSVMTETEAATYLGQSPNTLRQWRSLSRGPVYLKSQRGIRYHKSDLDAWLTSTRTLTAEARHG